MNIESCSSTYTIAALDLYHKKSIIIRPNKLNRWIRGFSLAGTIIPIQMVTPDAHPSLIYSDRPNLCIMDANFITKQHPS